MFPSFSASQDSALPLSSSPDGWHLGDLVFLRYWNSCDHHMNSSPGLITILCSRVVLTKEPRFRHLSIKFSSGGILQSWWSVDSISGISLA